jgi:iron complex outermembrane recepter protein
MAGPWVRTISSAGLLAIIMVPAAGTVRAEVGPPKPADPTSAQAKTLIDLSLEDLLNVQVTSVSKTTQRAADAPAAVTVITQDDIKRSGLHEIPDILRLAPGLFVQHGNQFTGTSVSARGFANTFADKLLVLQDGRPLYTPLFSGVYWNLTDYVISDLDRIEVIRGPGATLWGANAVNGVINITTKGAKETQGTLVDARVGTDGSNVAVRYGKTIGPDTFYRVSAKARYFADMDHAADPIGTQNRLKDSRVDFRVDRSPSEKNTLTLQGDLYRETNEDNNFAGVFIPGFTASHRNGANILARWTHVTSAQADTAFQVYWDRFFSGEALSIEHLTTVAADFQNRFALSPRHEMIYGLAARFQMDDVRTFFLSQPGVNPAAANTHVLGAFVQDTITVRPNRLKLIVGSKFEHNTIGGFTVQPSARMLWTRNETSTFWAGVSRAVRTPGRFQAQTDVHGLVPIAPNQSVPFHVSTEHPTNEILIADEAGYRRQIGKDFSIDISAFANHYQDLIDYLNLPPTFAGNPPQVAGINQTVDNARTAKTAGVEVEARWQVNGRWRLEASDSFLRMFVHDTAVNVGVPGDVIEHGSPRNMAQLHSYCDLTPALQLNVSAYYVGGTSGANVLQTRGPDPNAYVRLDANLAWTVGPRLELSLGIQNAADPRHFESPFSGSASAQVERAAYGSLTWHY